MLMLLMLLHVFDGLELQAEVADCIPVPNDPIGTAVFCSSNEPVTNKKCRTLHRALDSMCASISFEDEV